MGLKGYRCLGGLGWGSADLCDTFVWQVGERSFPLEAVKQLKQLFNLNDDASPHLTEASVVSVCGHPLLPQIFRPVCQGKATDIVLSRLGKTRPPTKRLLIDTRIRDSGSLSALIQGCPDPVPRGCDPARVFCPTRLPPARVGSR